MLHHLGISIVTLLIIYTNESVRIFQHLIAKDGFFQHEDSIVSYDIVRTNIFNWSSFVPTCKILSAKTQFWNIESLYYLVDLVVWSISHFMALIEIFLILNKNVIANDSINNERHLVRVIAYEVLSSNTV